jgi:hypothetical protein
MWLLLLTKLSVLACHMHYSVVQVPVHNLATAGYQIST